MNYVSVLFLYSKARWNLWKMATHLYFKYTWIQNLCRSMTYLQYYIQRHFFKELCEPPNTSWVHQFQYFSPSYSSSLNLSPGKNYKEIYEIISQNNIPEIAPTPVESNAFTLIKWKTPEYYLSFQNALPKIDISNTTISEVSFLSVQYTHPKMKDSILLNLPKSLFLVGNEILGPAFIYRWLLYQSNPFIYDKDYAIHIIDNNVQFVSMKYPQYCLIEENHYYIVHSAMDIARLQKRKMSLDENE